MSTNIISININHLGPLWVVNIRFIHALQLCHLPCLTWRKRKNVYTEHIRTQMSRDTYAPEGPATGASSVSMSLRFRGLAGVSPCSASMELPNLRSYLVTVLPEVRRFQSARLR